MPNVFSISWKETLKLVKHYTPSPTSYQRIIYEGQKEWEVSIERVQVQAVQLVGRRFRKLFLFLLFLDPLWFTG